MSNSKGKRIGFAGTIIFHIGLLALLFYLGFHTPLPLPEEEGILINFGNTNQGLGRKDPAPSKSSNAVPTATKPKQQATQTKPKESASSVSEKILTQDSEDAPAVPSAEEIANKKANIEKNKKIKA